MPRYCRQCGASLTEGAKFCRRCGAPTGELESLAPRGSTEPTMPIQPTEPMTGATRGSLAPTMPIQPTEPVSNIANEATRAVPPPQKTQPLTARRPLVLAGGAALFVIVAGVSFLLGSRWWSQRPPAANQTPEAGQPQAILERQPETAPPIKSKKPRSPDKKAAGGESKAPSASALSVAGTGRVADHLHRGHEHFNAKRYQEAIQEYQQVQRLDPANQDVHYLMGMAYEQLGQLDAALQAYQQCTSGPYANVAKQHVKTLEKKLHRSK